MRSEKWEPGYLEDTSNRWCLGGGFDHDEVIGMVAFVVAGDHVGFWFGVDGFGEPTGITVKRV